MGITAEQSTWERLQRQANALGITRHKLVVNIINQYLSEKSSERLEESI